MNYYFKINNQDFSHLVSTLKIGYEVLVSESSGRNANGDSVIDVVNRKHKVYVGLRHTFDDEMEAFLNALEDYVIEVSFRNPKTGAFSTIIAYHGTPEPEYYTLSGRVIYKPLNLNFIEL